MKDKVDHLLRQRQPLPDTPHELHDSIMRAVRSNRPLSDRQEEHPARLSWFAWPRVACGAAIVLVAAAGAFFWVRQIDRRADLTASVAVPQMTAQLQATWNLLDEVGTNPPAFLARPITRQLDQLSVDFQKTTATLLASLPMPPASQPPQ